MTEIRALGYSTTVEAPKEEVKYVDLKNNNKNGSLFSAENNSTKIELPPNYSEAEEDNSFFNTIKTFFSNIVNFFTGLFSKNKNEVKESTALEHDGKIDAVTMGKGSNSALFTGVSALNNTIKGKNLIRNSLNYDDNGVTVNFKGVDSDYYITNEELQNAKEDEKYSKGDDDMLALELAVEKLKKEISDGEYFSGGSVYHSINSTEEMIGILTGKAPQNFPLNSSKLDELVIDGLMQESLVGMANNDIEAKDIEGNPQGLQKFGEYTVRNISGETVILIDPHSPGKLIEVPFVSFMNNFTVTKADASEDGENSFYLAKADKSTKVNEDGSISDLVYDGEGRILSETKKDKNGNLIEQVSYAYDGNDPASYTKSTQKTDGDFKINESLTYKNNKLTNENVKKYDAKTGSMISDMENSYSENGNLTETYIANYSKTGDIKSDTSYIWYNELGEKRSEFIETNYTNGNRSTEAYNYKEYNIETGEYNLTSVQRSGFSKYNGSYYVTYDKNGNAVYKSKEETDKEILNKRLEALDLTNWQYEDLMDIIEEKDYLVSSVFACHRFDEINEAIFGKRQDTALEKELKALSEAYGVEIYSDNDLLSEEYAKANGIISTKTVPEGFVESLKEGFEQMKAHNQPIPEQIYLTGLFAKEEKDLGTANGVFSRKMYEAIAINANYISSNDWAKTVLYHESAHYADWNEGSFGYLSTNNTDIKINKNTTVFDTNPPIKASDIEKFIGSYALTNNQEFVAEITALLTSDIIVLDSDGKYTINKNKIENNSYTGPRNTSINWYNTKDEIDTLNSIMALYDIMTEKKITDVLNG